MARLGTLRAEDTINGAEGMCYASINGSMEEMLYVKDVEATMEKNKTQIGVLGYRGKKNKTTSWTGTGSMTIYASTSLYKEIASNYANNGIDTYFDMIIVNEDPTSRIGKQEMLLRKVNLDSIQIAKINIDDEVLEETIDFTFEGFELLEKYSAIIPE